MCLTTVLAARKSEIPDLCLGEPRFPVILGLSHVLPTTPGKSAERDVAGGGPGVHATGTHIGIHTCENMYIGIQAKSYPLKSAYSLFNTHSFKLA